MSDYKKSLCHLRWGYPNISLTRNEIRTCCKTPFQKVKQTELDEYGINLFLNTKYQLERRIEMVKGIRHSDCGQCWQIEDNGAISLRGNTHQRFLDYAEHHNLFDEFQTKNFEQISENVSINSKLLRSHKPFMLEVSLGNTCDLKCMYCNHVYSSQWATESLKNNRITQAIYDDVTGTTNQKFIDLFWEWVDTEAKFSLDRIGIIGGEPLITPEFYPFVDKLIDTYKNVEKNDTIIWIVTNLNTPESYFNKLMQYLPKLNEKFVLEILISMESTEEQAEYIRNGLNWKRFENNVYKLFDLTKNNDRVILGFLPSITALSVPRFTKFLQWVNKVCVETGKPAMLKQNIVTAPKCHTPFVLTNDYANYLQEAIDFISETQNSMPNFADPYGRWSSYLDFLKNLEQSIRHNQNDQPDLRRQFYSWFTDFDKLRGTNFINTFSELKPFYEHCKELHG